MSRPVKNPPARRLKPLRESAEYAEVSPRTIRRWIASGILTGYRRGPKLVMVDLNEIDQKATKVIPAANGQ